MVGTFIFISPLVIALYCWLTSSNWVTNYYQQNISQLWSFPIIAAGENVVMEEDPASGGEGDKRDNCICPAIYNPVCGVDEKNYSNPCSANCANVKQKCQVNCQRSFIIIVIVIVGQLSLRRWHKPQLHLSPPLKPSVRCWRKKLREPMFGKMRQCEAAMPGKLSRVLHNNLN